MHRYLPDFPKNHIQISLHIAHQSCMGLKFAVEIVVACGAEIVECNQIGGCGIKGRLSLSEKMCG